jgi:hypothetical protein
VSYQEQILIIQVSYQEQILIIQVSYQEQILIIQVSYQEQILNGSSKQRDSTASLVHHWCYRLTRVQGRCVP